MYTNITQRTRELLDSADSNVLSGSKLGLEKETLRIDENGTIAQTDHPAALGSALCNAQITTDFSEALLEMVTPPCDNAAQAIDHLVGLHQFILQRLPEGEGLWNTSMPCILNGDSSIRIGNYGTSDNGSMKQAYRRGLGNRYGRRMQAIAGIHFNYSLPNEAWPLWQQLHPQAAAESAQLKLPDAPENELATAGYFHMTRNLMRIVWLVPYLFGASPAICQTFLPSGADSDLETYNRTTRYAPFGTSLRMGEIGYRYKEDAPIDLSVRHDRFEHYLQDIFAHVTTDHPAYKEMGVKNAQGVYQQLNAKKLQIENEYYSSVRPKQIATKGEMPIIALKKRGVRYLELRSVDVSILDAPGLNLEQVAMLEMLMLFAWLDDNSPLAPEEMQANKQNVYAVAHRGREPDLMLQGPDGNITLKAWASEILDVLQPIAQWLDSNNNDDLYARSLQLQKDKVNDPSLTPSAQVIERMFDSGSFYNMVMEDSFVQSEQLMNMPVNQALEAELEKLVKSSIESQVQAEKNASSSFDTFLENYFSQLNPYRS